MGVVTFPYIYVTPVYLPATSSSSSFRLPQCRLPCPRKIQITPTCHLVSAVTLPCVLQGPSAHSHCRSTFSDLAFQTVQRDHLFPHSYSVAPSPSPYRCNLYVQVFRVVFGSSSSLCQMLAEQQSRNSHSRTRLLTTPLPVEWQSDICAAIWWQELKLRVRHACKRNFAICPF